MLLPSTFLHIKGISPKRELELWQKGIVSWDALEATLNPQTSLFEDQPNGGNIWSILAQSRRALQDKNADFFSEKLPSYEHYRVALTFPSSTLFVDIETTGLSRYYDYITLIGWSIGGEYGDYLISINDRLASLISVPPASQAVLSIDSVLYDFTHDENAKQSCDILIPGLIIRIDYTSPPDQFP